MNLLDVKIGARNSPLSKAQAEEVLQELLKHHPHVRFTPYWIKTHGDKNRTTSLRHLEKTDFFTKEIDEMQLRGDFRISIHSAKDLPDPLPKGLTVVALTKGVDSSDVIVINEELPKNPIIATSSIRREEEVLKRYPEAKIVDIRGTIHERLEELDAKKVDGVVMAKAALIRLGLAEKKHIPLDGPVAYLQGRLAVLARSDDKEMQSLFSCIDHRRAMLYLGIDKPDYIDKKVLHVPLIETKGLQPDFSKLSDCSHVLVTSKMAVRYFMQRVEKSELLNKQFISVGKKTTEALFSHGITNVVTSLDESQEGIIELIKTLEKPTIFWPHSNRSRDTLRDFLNEHNYCYRACILYETLFKAPPGPVDFDTIDEIFFSSPSTVDAFFHFFGAPPAKTLLTQGKVTKQHLDQIHMRVK